MDTILNEFWPILMCVGNRRRSFRGWASRDVFGNTQNIFWCYHLPLNNLWSAFPATCTVWNVGDTAAGTEAGGTPNPTPDLAQPRTHRLVYLNEC